MRFYNQLSSFLKKPAFKSAGIYTFSNFFVKSVTFLLLIIYSNPKYISVEENGLLNLLSSTVSLILPFISLGIIHATSVDFFKLKKEEFKNYFTTSFVMPCITMVLSIVIMLLLSHQLKASYNFPISFALIIPLLAFFSFCNEQYINIIRNNDDPSTYLRASLIRLFIEMSISIVLVVFFAFRWKGRVAGLLVANVVLFIMAFIYFKKNHYIFGKVRKEYIKSEIGYALPIIIMQISAFCLTSSDKFFLSGFTDNAEVGVYGYACVFATVIMIASSALANYVMPKIYQSLSQAEVDFKQIRKLFIFYSSACLLVFVFVVAFTPVIYWQFINKSYHEGLNYMYIIATGYFFWTIANFFYSFLFYKKQNRKILLVSISAIVINLSSNYFLIKNLGAKGAAISVMGSYFLLLIIILLISKREVMSIVKRNAVVKYESN